MSRTKGFKYKKSICIVMLEIIMVIFFFFFFQAEDGIRDGTVTGVQTCALPILAILLRSVSRNATAITDALDAANIRYVIVGMNNLFDTHEAHAARELFYYMAGRTASNATTVFDAWTNANLGLVPADLKSAIANVTKSRAALENPTERFGFYSIQRTFTSFLDQAGVR